MCAVILRCGISDLQPIPKGEEEGQFWIIAGGDLVLAASSQVLTSSLSCPAVRISCLSAVFYFLFLVARS